MRTKLAISPFAAAIRKAALDEARHTPDPKWAGRDSSLLVCAVCGWRVVGEGTVANPWRHK